MTTGEGGMVTTNDSAVAEQVRLLRNQGQEACFYHTILGYNLRLTELQAALGIAQLEKLEHFTRRRIANAAFLTEHLKGAVQTPVVRPGYRHVYQQYTIRVPGDRNAWAARLRIRGVDTAIRYALPIHQQPFFRRKPSLFRILSPGKKSNMKGSNPAAHLPVTESAAQQVLSLPVHPALSEEDLSKITKEVIALCE